MILLSGLIFDLSLRLRILPYLVDDFRVRKAIGLFPTVERMAGSPNGIRLRRLLAVKIACSDINTVSDVGIVPPP